MSEGLGALDAIEKCERANPTGGGTGIHGAKRSLEQLARTERGFFAPTRQGVPRGVRRPPAGKGEATAKGVEHWIGHVGWVSLYQ
jgi:hypothetical protein